MRYFEKGETIKIRLNSVLGCYIDIKNFKKILAWSHIPYQKNSSHVISPVASCFSKNSRPF